MDNQSPPLLDGKRRVVEVGVSNLFKNRFFALSQSGDNTLRKGKHIQKIHSVALESGASQKKPQNQNN